MMQIKNKILGLLLIGLLGSSVAFAQKAELIKKFEAAPGSLDISYEKWQLPNGLVIYIHEDHSDPLAHVEITYKVGSNREEPGMTGFAHFFEHMMFQGSEHVEDEEHFKIITAAGGVMNGNTTSDRTTYYQTVPSNQLETAFWLESDRMGFFLDAITKEKFETQRDAVKNEKSQNIENQPYQLPIAELMPKALYPPGHPYSWPVIGYVDDLDRVDHTHLKNFFLRWYGPNNAILTVAGDVESSEVVALAEKYFGPINKGPEVQKMTPDVPMLPIDQYVTALDNIYLPLTMMTFPTVPLYHRDEPALDLLTEMLGGGNNSILYKNFVKSEKAAQAEAYHYIRELSGELTISVLSYPDITFNETEALIRKTLDEFEKNEITQEALNRVKSKTTSQLIDYVSSVQYKAEMLHGWERMLNRPFNMSDELARYEKVSIEDIRKVYNKYLKGNKAVILNISPRPQGDKDSLKSENPYANIKLNAEPKLLSEGSGEWKFQKPANTFDRSRQPTPGKAKLVTVPEFYTAKLPNGIEIIGTQTNETPKVIIYMELGGGEIMQSDMKKLGLADLTAELMNEGTKKYTSEQISAALDNIGSEVYFSSGSQSATATIYSKVENIDKTLELFQEMLFNPRFDEKDFDRIKKQTVQGLTQAKKSADYLSYVARNKLLYGESIFGQLPSIKTVKKISLEDVKEFYKNTYTPTLTDIVVVGAIEKDKVLSKLQFLANWEGKKVTLPTYTDTDFPVSTKENKVYVVHKQDAPQSVITIGYRAQPQNPLGEYYRNTVMNYPLGGAFNSRINLNLREDKGYTYGIRSGFAGDKYIGNYAVQSSVKSEATDSAIVEIMKELRNYNTSGVNDDEVEFTKSSILQRDALSYETLSQKARFLALIQEYNLPKDYRRQQNDIVQSMTKEEFNTLAKKNIRPDEMFILVVGNKYRLQDKLEGLGYGKVMELDID